MDGLTAMMMASWWGYAAVVHLLLQHPDTDVNARNEVCEGPLTHACPPDMLAFHLWHAL